MVHNPGGDCLWVGGRPKIYAWDFVGQGRYCFEIVFIGMPPCARVWYPQELTYHLKRDRFKRKVVFQPALLRR